jgi:hypothetical protein
VYTAVRFKHACNHVLADRSAGLLSHPTFRVVSLPDWSLETQRSPPGLLGWRYLVDSSSYLCNILGALVLR